MTKAEFFRQQLDKPTDESKKWKMAILGLKGVAGFFAVGTLLFIFKPALAGQMTTMVQIAMTAWGGVVAVYLGAQGSVEFKATSALENTQEAHVEDKYEHVVVEGAPNAPALRPWSPVAVNE